MKITYYGHSCFAAEINGLSLLFDPFITGNPLASGINLRSVPADFILISHAHGDHMADAPMIARQTGAAIISNFEITQWFAKQRIEKVHSLNHGGSCDLAFGRAKYVNAIHSSSFPDGTYGGNPGGFVIESAAGSFYFAGDTALTLDMKLFGEATRLDFACLPIGGTFTMDVQDAVRAAKLLGCNRVLGIHYNTFPPIQIDTQAARAAFSSAGVELVLLEPGQTHVF